MPTKSSKKNEWRRLVELIERLARRLEPRTVKVMEVCGTHTVAARSAGLHALLPKSVRLISGPGCPVCVTPAGYVDQAVALALERRAHVMTYGDMLRVPGVKGSLEDGRRRGGRISVVYSITDALAAARKDPATDVVFLAIGFETTAPATAFAVKTALAEGLTNFKVFCAHKTIIPAMKLLVSDPRLAIDGFIAPGHVSVIIGRDAYSELAVEHARPCVVAGFDGEQMLLALVRILSQLAAGEAKVESVYASRVTKEGNPAAQAVIDEVFHVAPSRWRGIGVIDSSGLELREQFAALDARRAFRLGASEDRDPPGCRCADVIMGLAEPPECALFARRCTPATPVGACMVSREGSCSAFYKYRNAELPS